MQRELAFAQLVQTVQACRRCPRMEGRTRVLGPANGLVSARIVFVAEAPGRFGADASGTPLSGDRTGRTFEELLGAASLSRREIFITNAVLCNPRDQAGRNDRPTRTEIANCGQHLRDLIQILDPAWVVSLGNVALQALARLAPHECLLRRDVAKPVLWFDRWLLPLYHPGPQALLHRSLEVQRADYARLGELVRGRSDHQVGQPRGRVPVPPDDLSIRHCKTKETVMTPHVVLTVPDISCEHCHPWGGVVPVAYAVPIPLAAST